MNDYFIRMAFSLVCMIAVLLYDPLSLCIQSQQEESSDSDKLEERSLSIRLRYLKPT